MATNRNDIGSKFQKGDIPSQSDFAEIFSSFVHKDEDKADFQMVEAGTNNERYITPALLKAAFQNAGIIAGNCYIPFKEFADNFSGSDIQLANNPVEDSIRVYKNGQLLVENKDYTLNTDTAVVHFSSTVTGRNIEINYWSKITDTQSNILDPLLGTLSIPYKENFEADTFNADKITLKNIPIEQSIRVYKNGQLLREGQNKDYVVNYSTGLLTFSAVVNNRNIEVDYWYKSSISVSDLELNSQYVDLKTNQTIGGNKTFTEATESKSFIKTGGLPSQYLMADGSVSVSNASNYDDGHSPLTSGTSSGFQKFSNGLILQWAYLNSGTTTYSFPISWPNKAFSVVVSSNRTTSGSRGTNHVGNINQSYYLAVIDSGSGYMFAIGC